MRVALLLLLVGCGSNKNSASRRDVQGTLSLDGKPLVVTACRPGHGVTTFVELVTDKGKLRFEDRQLFWSTDEHKRGDRLDCEKLDRSWGGGTRTDGTSYFRGHLIFTCKGAAGALTGDVTVDCGNITADERASLDKNRQDLLDQQKAATVDAAVPEPDAEADRCADVEKHETELFREARTQALVQAKKAGLNPSADGTIRGGSGGPTVRAFPKPMAFTACREDKWPLATQECLINARDIAAWDACQTKDVRDGIERRQRE